MHDVITFIGFHFSGMRNEHNLSWHIKADHMTSAGKTSRTALLYFCRVGVGEGHRVPGLCHC